MFSDVFAQIESRFNPSHSRNGIHDPNARVAAISTIDKLVHSLLTRRNAIVPISLLPPELLARVFHLLVVKEPPFAKRRNLGWIRATHVCQHWRQVALDDSSLWARISGVPANTKWISEMLVRAKNAPLDIDLNAAAWSSREALLMIPPHLSHIRQARFHNRHGLYMLDSDTVREVYCSEAPALEHFELTQHFEFTGTDNYPTIIRNFRGNMLFEGHAPRLRTFSLSGVVIPWSFIPRGQLTQLKIAYSEEDICSPGDLNQLIDILINCPALEILPLEFCLPPQLTEFPHGRTIHLPHLSLLCLCGSTSRIMNMLKILKLPSSTTLDLDCIFKTTSINNDSEGLLLSVISAHLQCPAPVEFKSLTVTILRRLETSSLTMFAS